MSDLEAVPQQLFGRRLLAYCQANPEAATQVIDSLMRQGDQMARSLCQTIRQEVVAASRGD